MQKSPLKHDKYVMRFPYTVVYVLIGQASLAFAVLDEVLLMVPEANNLTGCLL